MSEDERRDGERLLKHDGKWTRGGEMRTEEIKGGKKNVSCIP